MKGGEVVLYIQRELNWSVHKGDYTGRFVKGDSSCLSVKRDDVGRNTRGLFVGWLLNVPATG